MNGMFQAVLLGVVQGLTEFLPVSSSGHLVLAQAAFGEDFVFASQAVAFDLVLHLGTLLPVLWFYRRELRGMLTAFLRPGNRPSDGGQPQGSPGAIGWLTADPHRHLAVLVVVGTIPTAILGIALKDVFERLFHSVPAVCGALVITGALLTATRFARQGDAAPQRLTVRTALVIGLVQGLAITPGISRSGSTIATALLLGLDRESAARFSFLLSIPAICGAVVLVLKDGFSLVDASAADLAAGFLAALVVGYLSLVMLVTVVKRGNIHRFAYYLLPAAAFTYSWLA